MYKRIYYKINSYRYYLNTVEIIEVTVRNLFEKFHENKSAAAVTL